MITHSELTERLSCDPENGELFWLSGQYKGKRAGWLCPAHGRTAAEWRIRINGRNYSRGRLIWFFVTGEWPIEIDHEDTDRLNDRWGNLRNATRMLNEANKGPYRNNKSGVKGIRFQRGRWLAAIQVDWKRVHLGTFETKEDAAAAYQAAAATAHGEFARTE